MFINISGYKFVSLPAAELVDIQTALKQQAAVHALKGTILLSEEGINAFLSGSRTAIDAYVQYLQTIPAFHDLRFKESLSNSQPFSRLLVRIKKEIISMGQDSVRPQDKTAPYIAPEQLKQWYDEQRDFIILDTRNDYEVSVGSFDRAVNLHIDNFRQFPAAIDQLPEAFKHKPVVTFCTGGIRCEKAAEYMQQQGFTDVYQLEGGILSYFEKVGGDYYHGECFVFDDRLTVNPALEATNTERCEAHQHVETAADLASVVSCTFCQHLHTSRKAVAQA